jgi:hypothetical protein
VPYLAQRSGKSARFSFADLLALSVTYELIQNMGMSIGTMHAGVDVLFRLLAQSKPSTYIDGVLILTATTARLARGDQPLKCDAFASAVVIPCRPFVRAVHERVLPGVSEDKQRNLPFAPRAVRR